MNLAVTAVGADHPGIVAGLTGVLLEFGGNVDDSQMSILHGQFAMMLIVSVPDGSDLEAITEGLRHAGRELDLDGVTVSPVAGLGRGDGPTHVLTVYAADRPGIVHDVTSLLAGYGVNITDLRTKRTGGSESPLYTMMVEISIPSPDPGLADALTGFAGEKQVEAHLAELESEVL